MRGDRKGKERRERKKGEREWSAEGEIRKGKEEGGIKERSREGKKSKENVKVVWRGEGEING